jgi:predicted Zn-dependent protease
VLQLLSEAFLRQGRLDLAIETEKKLVDLTPLSSPARVRLAQLYYSNGDAKRALADLDAVTKADAAYPVGWESLARVAISTRDWSVAEPAISHLETLDGQGLLAAYLRGEVLAGTGQAEPAIVLFSKVVSADPDTPLAEHALASLVRAYNGLGRLPVALQYVESLKSDSAFVANLLGECYRELGQTDQAVRAFEKAVAGPSPAHPEPYLNLARTLMSQHKTEQAINVLHMGAAALPASPLMSLMLAEIYGETGRYQEAIALYDDVLTANPGLEQAANNMVALISDYQYTDAAAMDRARRVAERFQGATDPIKVDTLGWVQYRLGNVPEALVLLSRAVGTGSGSVPPQLRYHYGAVLLKANQKEKAKVQLRAATEAGASYPGIEDARKMLETL